MTGGDHSKIRLGFNARLLQFADTRGWNRYAVSLLAELPALGVEPILYTDRPIHPDHLARLGKAGESVRLSPRMPYPAWEQLWLPRACRADRVDLLHSPFHFGLPWSRPCPMVLTLHDAIDRAFGDGPRGDYRSRFHQWVARSRADRIITPSEHARGDLIEYLSIDPSRITVIPEAAGPAFFAQPSDADRERVQRLIGRDGPYVFYVGGWEERKNVPFLVRAFAEADVEGLTLVLAGGKDEQKGEMAKLTHALDVHDRVSMLNYVSDADLLSFYVHSLAFIYPSHYEGFGLQLCEAMAAGCPTLAADATSLPEVLGSGGETFPLDSPSPLARLIRRIAADPTYRDQLSSRARARAADFSWRRAAELTAEVYRNLLGGRSFPQDRAERDDLDARRILTD